MIPLEQPCRCGRTWMHCQRCGSSSIYILKNESKMASAVSGLPIEVFTCKVCQNKNKSNELCKALSGYEEQKHKSLSREKDLEFDKVDIGKTNPVGTTDKDANKAGLSLADIINREETEE
jgi:hypothetical protein